MQSSPDGLTCNNIPLYKDNTSYSTISKKSTIEIIPDKDIYLNIYSHNGHDNFLFNINANKLQEREAFQYILDNSEKRVDISKNALRLASDNRYLDQALKSISDLNNKGIDSSLYNGISKDIERLYTYYRSIPLQKSVVNIIVV